MPAARVLQQDVHSVEINEQRLHPGKWFPMHRAFSCTDCLWEKLHTPRVPFLLGSKTRFGNAMSSSCSFLQGSTRTPSWFLILTYTMEGSKVSQQCQMWWRP